MSYYGLRKVKIVKTQDDKYNVACECYDSSIRSWNGKRVWEKTDHFYNKDFNTREELEESLFRNTLDGNFHGTGGKYSAVSWNTGHVRLTDRQSHTLDVLQKRTNLLREQVRLVQVKINNDLKEQEKDLTTVKLYEEIYPNNQEWKVAEDKYRQANYKASEYRYRAYKKQWLLYLDKEKQNKKTCKKSVISLNLKGYGRCYVKSLGSVKLSYTYYKDFAKVVKKPLEDVLEEIKPFMHDGNISEVELEEIK